MSILSLKHLFGLKSDVKDNVHFLEEGGDGAQIMYPSGSNIVVYNIEKKTQRFIGLANGGDLGTNPPPTPSSQSHSKDGSSASSAHIVTSGDVSAMCSYVPKGKNSSGRLLAVAERGDERLGIRPTVTVYHVDAIGHKRKGKSVLVTHEVNCREFVSLCFSPDGKHLLTQSGGPDWTLINWQWEKARPLQFAKVTNKMGAEIHQVRFFGLGLVGLFVCFSFSSRLGSYFIVHFLPWCLFLLYHPLLFCHVSFGKFWFCFILIILFSF